MTARRFRYSVGVLLCGLWLSGCSSSVTVREDGPVRLEDSSGEQTWHRPEDATDGHWQFTFGTPICVEDGRQVQIEDVEFEPTTQWPSPIEVAVRTHNPNVEAGDYVGFGVVEGPMTAHVSKKDLLEVEGLDFNVSCTEDIGDGQTLAEILTTVSVPPEGASFSGVVVNYSSGGHSYRARSGWRMTVCGTQVKSGQCKQTDSGD